MERAYRPESKEDHRRAMDQRYRDALNNKRDDAINKACEAEAEREVRTIYDSAAEVKQQHAESSDSFTLNLKAPDKGREKQIAHNPFSPCSGYEESQLSCSAPPGARSPRGAAASTHRSRDGSRGKVYNTE